jgi:hypothetical protein
MQVVFATPGMVLATAFIFVPFIVRGAASVLRQHGEHLEDAAAPLGASRLQIRSFGRARISRRRDSVGYASRGTTSDVDARMSIHLQRVTKAVRPVDSYR